MSSKKKEQLGMNPSTAAGRLLKDILYKLVVSTEQNACHQCGEGMTRDTFSIEHKKAWLDSEDPVGLYFDLGNISFSHRTCNYKAARKPQKKYHTVEARKKATREADLFRWHRDGRAAQRKKKRKNNSEIV